LKNQIGTENQSIAGIHPVFQIKSEAMVLIAGIRLGLSVIVYGRIRIENIL